MKPHSELTLRRVAALREMADLGCTIMQACILLELDYGSIYFLRHKFGISLRDGRRGRPSRIRERVLRDYGKDGMTPAVMAERYGTSANSVSATISNLRRDGKLPPRHQKPDKPFGGFAYLHMSSAVNYPHR
jgi:hypothetical protein